MKQFTPIKVLTLSALSLAAFTAFAMEKDDNNGGERIKITEDENTIRIHNLMKKNNEAKKIFLRQYGQKIGEMIYIEYIKLKLSKGEPVLSTEVEELRNFIEGNRFSCKELHSVIQCSRDYGVDSFSISLRINYPNAKIIKNETKVCCICFEFEKQILLRPMQCTKCHKGSSRICKKCIEKCKEQNNKCPTCNLELKVVK